MVGGLCRVLRGVSTKVLWEVVPNDGGRIVKRAIRHFEGGWVSGTLRSWRSRVGLLFSSSLYVSDKIFNSMR